MEECRRSSGVDGDEEGGLFFEGQFKILSRARGLRGGEKFDGVTSIL